MGSEMCIRDSERRNTKKRCDREDAEAQIEEHGVSDKKEVSVCDIGINALNAESMEERHDKVETKGENRLQKYCYYFC